VARYAAFLRAINVAGRRVKGTDLIRPLSAIGLSDVATFRASGNVVFAAGREPAGKLAARVEAALEEALGYHSAVFLRTASEVRAIAGHDPFPPRTLQRSAGKLQVAMLGRRPPAAARRAVLALATPADPLAFGPRELYWLPSGGLLESELDPRAIDRLLGPSTRRTLGTVEQLAAKHFPA
jgi:uncharacterized protein (DUF1697 family)